MNARLQSIVAEAEAQLSEEEKEGLAELIADYLADSDEAALLSPDEMAEIDEMLSRPLELADPAEVEAVFAKYARA